MDIHLYMDNNTSEVIVAIAICITVVLVKIFGRK